MKHGELRNQLMRRFTGDLIVRSYGMNEEMLDTSIVVEANYSCVIEEAFQIASRHSVAKQLKKAEVPSVFD